MAENSSPEKSSPGRYGGEWSPSHGPMATGLAAVVNAVVEDNERSRSHSPTRRSPIRRSRSPSPTTAMDANPRRARGKKLLPSSPAGATPYSAQAHVVSTFHA